MIQRWDMYDHGGKTRHGDGQWVLYADHLAALEELRAENAELKAEVERLQEQLKPHPQTKVLLESMEKAAEANKKNTPGIRRK
jgi:Tfp pilus assembly protein PilO